MWKSVLYLKSASKLCREVKIVDKILVRQSLRDFSLTQADFSSKKKDSDLQSLLEDMYKDFEQVESSKNFQEDLQEAKKKLSEQEATEEESEGYFPYKDADAPVIYDVDEEKAILERAHRRGEDLVLGKEKKYEIQKKYEFVKKKTDERGVFNVEEMYAIMEGERLKDIATIIIPASRNYADYLMIGTGRNARHIYSASQVVKKLYKQNAKIIESQISGQDDKGDSGWIAMDLGNIVLHLFTQEKRDYYNLETLWTVGSKYDDISEEAGDSLEELMSSHLGAFEPNDLSEEETRVNNRKLA